MENCKVVIQKRWWQSLKGGVGYTLYPSACLREKRPMTPSELWNNKRQKKDTHLERKMYQSPRGESVSFFYISGVLVRTGRYVRILIVGSCCYYLGVMKFRLLKFTQTRWTIFPTAKKQGFGKKEVRFYSKMTKVRGWKL